jgi:hypothetical protein
MVCGGIRFKFNKGVAAGAFGVLNNLQSKLVS